MARVISELQANPYLGDPLERDLSGLRRVRFDTEQYLRSPAASISSRLRAPARGRRTIGSADLGNRTAAILRRLPTHPPAPTIGPLSPQPPAPGGVSRAPNARSTSSISCGLGA